MIIISKDPSRVIPNISEKNKLILFHDIVTNCNALGYMIKSTGKYQLRGSIKNNVGNIDVSDWSYSFVGGQTIVDLMISYWQSRYIDNGAVKTIYIIENSDDLKTVTDIFEKDFPDVIGEFQEVFNGNNRLQSS